MHALRELADVEPAIVWFCASDQVRQLAEDADEDVAGPAGELLTRLAHSEQARRVPDAVRPVQPVVGLSRARVGGPGLLAASTPGSQLVVGIISRRR